jgi:hypothetical protein
LPSSGAPTSERPEKTKGEETNPDLRKGPPGGPPPGAA